MHKLSLAAGIVVGAGVTLAAVIAFPQIVPTAQPERARQTRERPEARPEPEKTRPAAPARQPERPPTPPEVIDILNKADGPVDLKDHLAIARRRANETAAIATLRNITSAQAQFQSTARADENANGIGEYGCFLELSGQAPVRGVHPLNPPVLSTAFRKVEHGRVKRSGYYFQVFLPAPAGTGLAEREPDGFRPGELDARLAETTWCAYAWPVERGATGNRTFFVNQAGDILETKDGEYSGDRGPPAYAAFDPSSRAGITGATAHGKVGADRATWKIVG